MAAQAAAVGKWALVDDADTPVRQLADAHVKAILAALVDEATDLTHSVPVDRDRDRGTDSDAADTNGGRGHAARLRVGGDSSRTRLLDASSAPDELVERLLGLVDDYREARMWFMYRLGLGSLRWR